MNFICNRKDGCKVTDEVPDEIKNLLDEWEKETEEKYEERKKRGCWNPSAVVCDCPACGGEND